MAVVTLTKDNFEEVVLKADKPVLVDFWASWCAPCRMLSPIVDEIGEENDAFVVGKVNVDEEQELAIQYKVASIPTLLVFENGELKNKNVGVIGKSDILNLLKENIAVKNAYLIIRERERAIYRECFL